MTKKKKPKPATSRKASSSPPSSSSSRSYGVNEQDASRSPVNSSLIVCDLEDAVIAGSVTLPSSDLHLETPATVQIGDVEIDLPPSETIGITSPCAKSTSTVAVNPVTPTISLAQAVAAVQPDTQAQEPIVPSSSDKATENNLSNTQAKPANEWVGLFKGRGKGKELEKKGTPFTLPSGEICIKIPNSVIEKNKKSWECFIIGQFYSDPPAQSLIHSIVNGIWSKQYRDITVSKLEGNAFLFRIPNVATRNRVIYQRLWQIEGQTMFVAHWEPGNLPEKPALTSAPIWLELRNVPLQFFNEDGLERIAGLVGHPKYLHPTTANKTNLEVAKVLTIIDPRQPLPEAVNVQFDSGDIVRVGVSSPWMPPVCSHYSCPRSKGHHHKKEQSKKRYVPVRENAKNKESDLHGKPVAQSQIPSDWKGKSIDQQIELKGSSDPGITTKSKQPPKEYAESSKANGGSSFSEVE
ncbi:unnamed protein product, partial [Brassica rapa subsp. narinosa]